MNEEIPQEKIVPEKPKRKRWLQIGVIILLLIFFLFGAVLIFSKENGNSNLVTSSLKKSSETSASPTPFPFQEITIPYLRSRDYKSSLSELKKSSENANYTSYLASYDSDGFKVNGLLTIPKGMQPIEGWPAIVFVHGYIPPSQYQTLVNYSSYVDVLARNGFVVFKIDLRGHADSEGEPGGAYYSSDYIIDTLNARAALSNSDFVNSEKIGLWGHSMAGNVVSRSLAAAPDIPAVVIWAGAVYSYEDFQKIGINDNSYRPPSDQSESRRKRTELFNKYGQFNPESEFWKQVPMTNYLDGIKGAIQINHAVDDNVVSIEYSRNLMSILDKTSIAHELKEYPSGGHNLSGAAFNAAMQNTIDFFTKYLK